MNISSHDTPTINYSTPGVKVTKGHNGVLGVHRSLSENKCQEKTPNSTVYQTACEFLCTKSQTVEKTNNMELLYLVSIIINFWWLV